MSLLIKALQKAEQSKGAKAGDEKPAATGLALELAPQEPATTTPHTLDEASLPLDSRDAGLLSQGDAGADIELETANPKTQQNESKLPLHEPSLIDELGFNLADEAGFSEPLAVKKMVESPKSKNSEAPKDISSPPPLRAEPLGVAAPPPVAAPAPVAVQDNVAQREAAASLLGLQKDEKRKPQGNNRRSFYMGAVALVLLLILGGGFYYYLETLDQPQLIALTPPSPQSPSAAIAVAPTGPNLTETSQPELVAPDPALDTMSVAPTEEKSRPVTDADAPRGVGITEVVETKNASAAEKTKNPQTTSTGDSPMKVARVRKSEPTVNPTQVAAYQAFLAGDDQTASRLYRHLLQSDSRNVDALLGLAAVAARQDRLDEAVRSYQHALELDPRNSIAQAGLITMLGQTNPGEAESRLKNLLAQQPDAVYLHAALGNTYAELERWPEAQQSYFQAFSVDSGNPDYAFNLAVSLDQMRKYDLALDYYQKAAVLSAKQGGGIDKAALDSRIEQLRTLLAK